MATTTQHAPGTFCWPELATTDQSGAKAFYSALFGWESTDSPIGEGATYTMLSLQGRNLGALYTLDPKERSHGIPPHWNSYVSVESADRSAAKAKTLGGTILAEPFDVMEHGRMAVLQDPTGAMFCLWEPKQHPGAGVLDEVGALCWTELMTSDASKAQAFYTGLFGWKAEAKPMGTATYTIYMNGDAQAAGMMQITKEMGPLPPHWMIYFAVGDCDATVAKTGTLGGRTIMPPRDIPNVGRFAILQDPQGAVFSVITLSEKA